MYKRKISISFFIILSLILVFTSCVEIHDQTYTPGQIITPEQAVQNKLKKVNYKPGDSYEYAVLNNYIFLLYNEVIVTGSYFDNEGYEFYIHWGSKLNLTTPQNQDLKGIVEMISVMKDQGNYLIMVSGYKENEGVLVTDTKSPFEVYNNQNKELTKFFDIKGDQNRGAWIEVLNSLPDDYCIYAVYHDTEYPLIDAKGIKQLVG